MISHYFEDLLYLKTTVYGENRKKKDKMHLIFVNRYLRSLIEPSNLKMISRPEFSMESEKLV